jgi:hypothetical protein
MEYVVMPKEHYKSACNMLRERGPFGTEPIKSGKLSDNIAIAIEESRNVGYSEGYDAGLSEGSSGNKISGLFSYDFDALIEHEILILDYSTLYANSTYKGIITGHLIISDGQNYYYGIDTIGAAAFEMCHNLSKITIPRNITKIEEAAFGYCESLNTIIFEGTMEEWDAVEKKASWNYHVPAEYVECSDGLTTIG